MDTLANRAAFSKYDKDLDKLRCEISKKVHYLRASKYKNPTFHGLEGK
jgi:hypothetical protein